MKKNANFMLKESYLQQNYVIVCHTTAYANNVEEYCNHWTIVDPEVMLSDFRKSGPNSFGGYDRLHFINIPPVGRLASFCGSVYADGRTTNHHFMYYKVEEFNELATEEEKRAYIRKYGALPDTKKVN